jgi:release factor glutamine methyltransferase
VADPRKIVIQTHEDVYEPAADTELLVKSVRLRKGERVLEIGTGTGIVAIHCAKLGCRVTATDIDRGAIELARRNAAANDVGLDLLEGDMFAPVKGVFDVIILNPPYLPTEADDLTHTPIDRALDGGPDGTRIALMFIEGLPRHMAEGGRAYMVTSSLQDAGRIEKALLAARLAARSVGKERFAFETVSVMEIRHPPSRTPGKGVHPPASK